MLKHANFDKIDHLKVTSILVFNVIIELAHS
jgi:hypothetical protein